MYKYEDTRSDLYKSLKKLGEYMKAAEQYDKTRFSSAKAQRKWEAEQEYLKRSHETYKRMEREREMWNNESSGNFWD
ncbi:MAG: hypothetical protein LBJ67_07175 [Planctomycetaceae bacterium]|jgi:hypothetical protein|nr:hypothetical protein [Planctomycetaceae bacterium]